MAASTEVEARELTAEERESRAEECYALEAAIKQNIAVGREAMWELSRNLWAFNEANGHTALGYETQEEWLAQPEIGMTRTQFFRLVRRHKELVVNRSIPESRLLEMDPSKIDIVLTAIEKNEAPLNDILVDVQQLGARDLRDTYIGKKSAPGPDVIDGKAIVIESKPKGKKSTDNGSDPANDKVLEAYLAVDSFIDLGGDRRRAKRQWAKLLEIHPLFDHIAAVGRYVNNEEGAPSKEEVVDLWIRVSEALQLSA